MTIWDFLMIAAVLVVLFTLVMGMLAMAKGTPEARLESNKWMWRRIYAQGGAVIVLLIAVTAKGSGAG
ncbi:MAG: HIG1 domain-containing protein [Robiginitomaculum sp.]